MHSATLTVKQARGLLLAAPKKDPRFYLVGVHIDFADGRAVATDGVVLIALNLETEGTGQVIVPRAPLESVTRGGKTTDRITITAEPNNLNLSIVRDSGLSVRAQAVEGTFPDYWRVLPDNPSGDPAQFDPEVLARAHKALQAVTNARDTYLAHNGEQAALLCAPGYSCRGLAVIMPCLVAASAPAEFLKFKHKGETDNAA